MIVHCHENVVNIFIFVVKRSTEQSEWEESIAVTMDWIAWAHQPLSIFVKVL